MGTTNHNGQSSAFITVRIILAKVNAEEPISCEKAESHDGRPHRAPRRLGPKDVFRGPLTPQAGPRYPTTASFVIALRKLYIAQFLGQEEIFNGPEGRTMD
jgi:hypothetical protein